MSHPNFGFAPAASPFDKAGASYVERLKNTTVIAKTSAQPPTPLTNLAEFVAELKSGTQVNRPIGDIYLVSHGSRMGSMDLQLDSQHTGGTYENIDAVATAKTIAIDATVYDPRPQGSDGHPIPCVVHFVGCFIGSFEQYVRRFKEALGGNVSVVAARNWDGFYLKKDGRAILKGWLRFLLSDFRVAVDGPLGSRDEVKKAFADRKLDFHDGKPIPDDFWEEVIPKRYDTDEVQLTPMTVKLVPKVERLGSIPVFCRYSKVWDGHGPFTLAGGPSLFASEQAQRAFIRSQLQAWPTFAASHPLPTFTRAGFATFDDYINGLNWSKLPGTDIWYGWRVLYMCAVPIVTSNTDRRLIYDYVSANGQLVRQQLDESNAKLFLRLP